MKLHFCKNETGNIQVQIETGTVLSEFNYIEMLKQLTQDNQIECDWGALDEDERTKLKELLDKIREAVSTGMNKPLEYESTLYIIYICLSIISSHRLRLS